VSRQILITCDFCGAARPAAETGDWGGAHGLDACNFCMVISRPLSEVLEAIRCAAAGGLFVSAADIIPPVRTRPRRALPES
jgi:hypothetical protein